MPPWPTLRTCSGLTAIAPWQKLQAVCASNVDSSHIFGETQVHKQGPNSSGYVFGVEVFADFARLAVRKFNCYS